MQSSKKEGVITIIYIIVIMLVLLSYQLLRETQYWMLLACHRWVWCDTVWVHGTKWMDGHNKGITRFLCLSDERILLHVTWCLQENLVNICKWACMWAHKIRLLFQSLFTCNFSLYFGMAMNSSQFDHKLSGFTIQVTQCTKMWSFKRHGIICALV